MTSESSDFHPFQRRPTSPSLLYSSRRKFLASAGKSCIEVPPEFQTRRQAQRKTLQRKDRLFGSNDGDDDDDMSISSYGSVYANLRSSNLFAAQKDRFQNLLPNANKGAGGKQQQDNPNIIPKRRRGKFALGLVILESNEFDRNQENWREETQAGVTYWVHKESGEIVTECPWLRKRNSLLQFSNSKKRLIGDPTFQETNDTGTGSLVYDRSEVDELFKLLEEVETKKSVSANNSPIKYPRDYNSSSYAYDSPLSIKSI